MTGKTPQNGIVLPDARPRAHDGGTRVGEVMVPYLSRSRTWSRSMGAALRRRLPDRTTLRRRFHKAELYGKNLHAPRPGAGK